MGQCPRTSCDSPGQSAAPPWECGPPPVTSPKGATQHQRFPVSPETSCFPASRIASVSRCFPYRELRKPLPGNHLRTFASLLPRNHCFAVATLFERAYLSPTPNTRPASGEAFASGSGEGVPHDRWVRLAAVVDHGPEAVAGTLQLTDFVTHFHRPGDENGTRAIEYQDQ